MRISGCVIKPFSVDNAWCGAGCFIRSGSRWRFWVWGGVGFWVIDPAVPTLADGLWLAFTTAATVGYGDVVPSTHLSRSFSVLVVLLGLAVLSLVTASLAAIFVEQEVDAEERDIERDLMREIRSLREEVHAMRDALRKPEDRPRA